VLALGILPVGMPAHHDAAGVLSTQDPAFQRQLRGMLGIGGEIAEKRPLHHTEIRDARLHDEAGLTADQRVVIAGTFRPVMVVRPLVNRLVRLASEAPAQVGDFLQAVFLGERDEVCADHQRVLDAGDRERHEQRRADGLVPHHVALRIFGIERERGIGVVLGQPVKLHTMAFLQETLERAGDFPLPVHRVFKVETRMAAVREALQREEQRVDRDVAVQLPVRRERDDRRRGGRVGDLRRNGLGRRASGKSANTEGKQKPETRGKAHGTEKGVHSAMPLETLVSAAASVTRWKTYTMGSLRVLRSSMRVSWAPLAETL
jgi:hypothetical protein